MYACSYIATAASELARNVFCISKLFSREVLPSKVQKNYNPFLQNLTQERALQQWYLIRAEVYTCFLPFQFFSIVLDPVSYYMVYLLSGDIRLFSSLHHCDLKINLVI